MCITRQDVQLSKDCLMGVAFIYWLAYILDILVYQEISFIPELLLESFEGVYIHPSAREGKKGTPVAIVIRYFRIAKI